MCIRSNRRDVLHLESPAKYWNTSAALTLTMLALVYMCNILVSWRYRCKHSHEQHFRVSITYAINEVIWQSLLIWYTFECSEYPFPSIPLFWVFRSLFYSQKPPLLFHPQTFLEKYSRTDFYFLSKILPSYKEEFQRITFLINRGEALIRP